MPPTDEPQHVGPLTPDPDEREVGRHRLGEHVVGQRVVVRRLIPGQVGPTGGPAFTDVLGIAEAWHPELVVRRADDTRVAIPHALIVSGKPVPPRPNPLLRISGADARARMAAAWPDAPAPGASGPETLWLASLARVRRTLTRRADEAAAAHRVGEGPGVGAEVAVVEHDDRTVISVTLPLGPGSSATALGEAAVTRDWVALRAVGVPAAYRRQGWASLVLADLLDAAVEAGATTVAAWITLGDGPAEGFAEALGLARHHTAGEHREG